MFTELEELFKINIEEKTKEEVIGEIKDCIKMRIDEEKYFYDFLALYGISSIIKIIEVCPFFYLDKIFDPLYKIFLSYLKKEKDEDNDEDFLNDIYSKIFEEYSSLNIFDFSKLLFTNDKTKENLFSISCLININNGMFIVLISLIALELSKK
jgi:hypothetical protein